MVFGAIGSTKFTKSEPSHYSFTISGQAFTLDRTDSHIRITGLGKKPISLKVSTKITNKTYSQVVLAGLPLDIQQLGIGDEDVVIESEREVQASDLENSALKTELWQEYRSNPELLVYSESRYFPASFQDATDVAFAATLPASTTFRYTNFIPEYQVDAPYLVCTPGDNRSYAFLGDNRTWSVSSSAYRTRMNVSIDWLNGGATTYTRTVHATHRYVKIGSSYVFDEAATASNSTMHLRVDAKSNSVVAFEMWQNVANPLCNSLLTGGIRFDYFVAIERAGFYSVEGVAVKVPNHEVYIMDSDDGVWKTVFRRNHVDFSCLEFWAYDPAYCTNDQSYYVTR